MYRVLLLIMFFEISKCVINLMILHCVIFLCMSDYQVDRILFVVQLLTEVDFFWKCRILVGYGTGS